MSKTCSHDERRAGRGDPEAGRAARVARRHRDLFGMLRRWFDVPAAVPIDLTDIDSAVLELGDPEMIAALAMRKLQALRLLATPGVRTTTDVVVAIVNDLDRALLQAPDLRLRRQVAGTDWDAALEQLSTGEQPAGSRRRPPVASRSTTRSRCSARCTNSCTKPRSRSSKPRKARSGSSSSRDQRLNSELNSEPSELRSLRLLRSLKSLTVAQVRQVAEAAQIAEVTEVAQVAEVAEPVARRARPARRRAARGAVGC